MKFSVGRGTHRSRARLRPPSPLCPGKGAALGLLLLALLVGSSLGGFPGAGHAPVRSGSGPAAVRAAPGAMGSLLSGNSYLLNETPAFPGPQWQTVLSAELPPAVSSLDGARASLRSPQGQSSVEVALRVTDLTNGSGFRYLNGTTPSFSGPWYNATTGAVVGLNASARYRVTLSAVCSGAQGDCQVGGGPGLPTLELTYNRSGLYDYNSTYPQSLRLAVEQFGYPVPSGAWQLDSVGTTLEILPGGASGWTYSFFANVTENGTALKVASLERVLSAPPAASSGDFPLTWTLSAPLDPQASYWIDLTVVTTPLTASQETARLGGAGRPSMNLTAAVPSPFSAAPGGRTVPLPTTFSSAPALSGPGSYNLSFRTGNGTPLYLDPVGSSAGSVGFTYEWPGSFSPTLTAVRNLDPTLNESVFSGLPGAANYTVAAPPAWDLHSDPSPAAGKAPLSVSLYGGLGPWGTAWEYTVFFGSGQGQDVGLPGLNGSATHVYTQTGRYAITLEACDAGHFCDVYPGTIPVVTTVYPEITASLSPVDAGVPVTLTPYVVGGSNSYVNYTWDLGDGTTVWGNRTVNQSYPSPGTYPITLTVRDSQGNVGTGTLNLTVEPTLTVVPTLSGTDGPAPQLFQGEVAVSGGTTAPAPGLPGMRSNVTVTWTFPGLQGSGPVFSHLFPFPGASVGTLFVNDTGGSRFTFPLAEDVTGGTPAYAWPVPRGDLAADGVAQGPGPLAPHVQAQIDLPPGAITGLVTAPGGPVIVAYPTGVLWALDPITLEVRWQENLTAQGVRFAASPSVGGGAVFLPTEEGRLLAFNLSTGNEEFSAPVGSPGMSYLSPLPYQGEVYQVTNATITDVNESSGQVLWQVPNPTANASGVPVLAGGALYLAGVGYLYAVALTDGGSTARYAPGLTPGALAFQGGYFFEENATGEVLTYPEVGPAAWQAPLSGTGSPLSLAIAGGHVFAGRVGGAFTALAEGTGAVDFYGPTNLLTSPSVSGRYAYLGLGSAGTYSLLAEQLTGGTGWALPLAAAPQGDLAISDGLLYLHTVDGSLQAIGYPPLTVSASVNRTGAAAGQNLTFTAVPAGGDGSTETVTWAFSDGSTATGWTVQHAYPAPGPAWAEAVATNANGSVSPTSRVLLDLLPPLSVRLSLNATGGASPFLLALNATTTGGSGSYPQVDFLIDGPVDLNLTGPAVTARLTLAGSYSVEARARDSVGDVALSPMVTVRVTAPPPTAVVPVARPAGPGAVNVSWSPYVGPGFASYQVGYTLDGGNLTWSALLTSRYDTGSQLVGLPLGGDLSVVVNTTSVYGSYALSAPVNLTVPLFAPVLTVAPAPGLPGQALLSWTLPTVDRFSAWTLTTTGPNGASVTVPLPLNASARELVAPPASDLGTTTYALGYVAGANLSIQGPGVPFTPLFLAPPITLAGTGTAVTVSFPAVGLPDLQSVEICYRDLANGRSGCPRILASGSSNGTLVDLPAAGDYQLWLHVTARNGFSFNGTATSYQAGAAGAPPAWYLTSLLTAPLWMWLVVALLLVALVLVSRALYQERNELPPLLDTLLPWGEETPPPPSPPGRKIPRPARKRLSKPLHVHGNSHPHRHERPHRRPVRALPPAGKPRERPSRDWLEEMDHLDEEVSTTAEEDGTPIPRKSLQARAVSAPAPVPLSSAEEPEPPEGEEEARTPKRPPRERPRPDEEPTL